MKVGSNLTCRSESVREPVPFTERYKMDKMLERIKVLVKDTDKMNRLKSHNHKIEIRCQSSGEDTGRTFKKILESKKGKLSIDGAFVGTIDTLIHQIAKNIKLVKDDDNIKEMLNGLVKILQCHIFCIKISFDNYEPDNYISLKQVINKDNFLYAPAKPYKQISEIEREDIFSIVGEALEGYHIDRPMASVTPPDSVGYDTTSETAGSESHVRSVSPNFCFS